jgi:hypothetical protein
MDTEQQVPLGMPQAAGAPASAPLAVPPAADRNYFSRRFLLVYVALGLILLGSIAAFVVFAIRPAVDSTAAWSDWSPSGGTNQQVAKQIADHIAPRYHLAGGGQLVAIVASNPTVTAGTQNIALNAVAVHAADTGLTNVKQVAPGLTQMYTLCGLGNQCTIASGQPSLIRGQLVRREALETALYTFKYMPHVNSIVVFMPPARGATGTTVLFFEREALSEALKVPLNKTLPLSRPPLPIVPNTVEMTTIDRLTLPHLYGSTLTQLQSGGALLVLTPVA